MVTLLSLTVCPDQLYVLLLLGFDPCPELFRIASNSSEGIDDSSLAQVKILVEIRVEFLRSDLNICVVNLDSVPINNFKCVISPQNWQFGQFRHDVLRV